MCIARDNNDTSPNAHNSLQNEYLLFLHELKVSLQCSNFFMETPLVPVETDKIGAFTNQNIAWFYTTTDLRICKKKKELVFFTFPPFFFTSQKLQILFYKEFAYLLSRSKKCQSYFISFSLGYSILKKTWKFCWLQTVLLSITES